MHPRSGAGRHPAAASFELNLEDAGGARSFTAPQGLGQQSEVDFRVGKALLEPEALPIGQGVAAQVELFEPA